jgi:hypothetical protein
MWIIIWIISLVLGPMISDSRGNGGFAGFWWALFLGPIGVLIVLLIPKSEKNLEQAAIVSGDMKKCPYCAELIKHEAIRCRFCSADLSTSAPADVAAPVVGARPNSSPSDQPPA